MCQLQQWVGQLILYNIRISVKLTGPPSIREQMQKCKKNIKILERLSNWKSHHVLVPDTCPLYLWRRYRTGNDAERPLYFEKKQDVILGVTRSTDCILESFQITNLLMDCRCALSHGIDLVVGTLTVSSGLSASDHAHSPDDG